MPETIFDHPVITSRYFFPVDAEPLEPLTVQVPGATLLCRAVKTPGATHTLLHFHGNGETVSDYESRAGFDLTEPGMNALFATYRGYGGSTGEPGLTRGFDDTAALMAATGVPRRTSSSSAARSAPSTPSRRPADTPSPASSLSLASRGPFSVCSSARRQPSSARRWSSCRPSQTSG